MFYNYPENNIVDTDIKDSLTRQEEAYLNSYEYKRIFRQKNWLVVGLIMTWLALILVCVLT
ncbi:MAG TPA: hypothetical protein VK559_02270 [Ferruginibacter sp.]|nr:hypothetical protein [Ferruginibacter sp.]